MQQMTSLLIYLKENKVVHSDLNLKNFMLAKANDLSHIKVIDFGFSKNLTNTESIVGASGTPNYIAPENLIDMTSIRGDVWSLGIVMYSLLSGSYSIRLLKNIHKEEVNFNHTCFVHISPEAKDLMTKMLDKN